MNQQALDFTARARATDPSTSHRAAARVTPTIADRVLEELRVNGPRTAHELADRLKLQLVTVSPRMRPLAAKGKVAEHGESAGRTVWRAV